MLSAELIGILTVGVALAALHVTTLRAMRTELRTDIRDLRGVALRPGRIARRAARLAGRTTRRQPQASGGVAQLSGRVAGHVLAVDDRVRALDDRMRAQERSTAKVEGLLEGLGAAVVVRAGPWSGAPEPAPGRRSEQAQG